jgi:hypothetical protein
MSTQEVIVLNPCTFFDNLSEDVCAGDDVNQAVYSASLLNEEDSAAIVQFMVQFTNVLEQGQLLRGRRHHYHYLQKEPSSPQLTIHSAESTPQGDIVMRICKSAKSPT